ncbi:MAG: choice-of-anchor D domain-containing protein [Chitinophagaceae bacterium]|nr:choice-of-anchor D domain-containing protein [Chitinophagaceae bacterium]
MKKIIFFLIILCSQYISHAQNIAAGEYHSLWLPCSQNIPQSWGINTYGQLGDSTLVSKTEPVNVSGLNNIIDVASGDKHVIFLKSDGTVWACGYNFYGQLGDGTTANRTTPVQITSLSGIIAISAGGSHSLFLKSDSTVWSCGYNNSGQLGDNSTTNRNTPVQVSGLSGIVAISAGDVASHFLKSNGTVWACGNNTNGTLGDGTNINRLVSVQLSGISNVTAISGGGNHTLFLKADSTVWSCGYNSFGQLGDGTTINRNTPVQIPALSGITNIATGLYHSLFIKNNGTAWACGYNAYSQLGDATITNRTSPVQVIGLSGIISCAGGGYHSLFLKNNQTVWACGMNSYGQLGDSTMVNRSIAIQTHTTLTEINVKGNNVNIVDGDVTPAASDHTNFGNVVVGTSPTRVYTIQNLGNTELYISSITCSHAMFSVGALTPSGPIAPNASATFVLTFSPTSTGIKNGTITINNNDCDEGVYTYAIRGTGVTTCPTLTFNETHVEACIGNTNGVITLSGSAGGSGPYSFSKDSGITYQSSNIFSNLAPGIYQMRNKDMNGCESAAMAVNINDLTPPTIICPPDTFIYLDVYSNCTGNYTLPPPIVNDNCGAFYTEPATLGYRVNSGTVTTTTSGTGANISFAPIDTNYITWFATDPNGNTDSCTTMFVIYDTIPPLFEPVFNNYAFETSTGVSLEDLSTGATEIIPSGSDNVSSAVQQIPFNFDFHSVVYQQFSVSSNGLIGFGTTPVTTSAANSTTTNQHNKLYALWDNLHTGTNGSVKYKVVGTRPNRKLVIEFNVRNAAELGNYTKTFQVWLCEGSHKVQYVYGNGTNMPSATIGVRGSNATVFNDVTTTNHSSSKSIINDNNTDWPGAGRSYSFTPAIFATAAAGSCGANVTFDFPNFTDCNIVMSLGYYSPGNFFPVGTTQMAFLVSDATPAPDYDPINTVTYTIPVIVEDTELPVITCSGPVSINTTPGLCTGAVTVNPPVVTDNCATLTPNNGLNFDGINDIVKVAPTSVINTMDQTQRTVEVSFRVNDKNISSHKQVLWEEGGAGNGLNLYVYDGNLYYGIYSTNNGWTGTWLSTPNILSGQWHKATLVFGGGYNQNDYLMAYLDGNLVGSADSSATLGAELALHNIGQNGIGGLANNGRFHDGTVTLTEGHYFGGDIDELRIWNTARNPIDLLGTSLLHLTGIEPGLVLYYNFNQGVACGNNAGINFLDDNSSTNLNGVLTNMTLNGSCVSNWTSGSPALNSPITLTNSFNNTSNASGNYPIGTTNVVWTASDASGNSVTCTQIVTVTDNQAPTLLSPGNQNLNVIANTCAANYTIADPFTDNCTGGTWGYSTTGATILTSSGNTNIDGTSSGVLSFNKGTTIVTLTGTDGTNAAASTTFTVTVTDNQAPTLVVPANQNLNVIANTCAANYTIADPFTDNCTGGFWGYSTTGATVLTSSGNTKADGTGSGVLSFNKGTTIVTLTGTDGTNAATSTTFTVTVSDNQVPTLNCFNNQILTASNCTANYTIPDPISDNCIGSTWSYILSGATIDTVNNIADGTGSGPIAFNVGTTNVLLSGIDASSNQAITCTRTVTVNAPEANVQGNGLTIVNGDITPSASDSTDFGICLVGNSMIRTFTLQNTGTSNLNISSINSNNVKFTVSPLTPSSPIAPGNSATFAITFTPTANGIISPTISIQTNDCDEASYTFKLKGTGIVCSNITFTQNHVEACIGSSDGSITITNPLGGTSPYTYSKDSGLIYQSSNVFSNLPPAIYQIRLKDVNGCVSSILAVNVNDQTPPTIVCPSNITVYQNFDDSCFVTYADSLPVIADNCLLPIGTSDSFAAIRVQFNNSGSFFNPSGNFGGTSGSPLREDLPLGINTITYLATDSAGNSTSCIQTITVLDTLAPLFEPIFNNYKFENSTSFALEDLSTGATEIIPAGSDNVSSAVQQIPFYFDFHSVVYRQFSVSSNGLIGFGTSVVTNSAVNSTTVNQHNKIYACWDNLHTGTNGSVKYKVIGTMPNRKLVIEWNVRNTLESGNYTKTFQAWLWEGSHKVQLVYGSGTSLPSATIGVRGPNSSVYHTVTSSNHTGSKTVVNDTNTVWPGAGHSYIFSPAIFATAPSGSCNTNVTWADPQFLDCNTIVYTANHLSGDNFPVGTTPLVYTVYDATPMPNPVFMNSATYNIPIIVEDTHIPILTAPSNQTLNVVANTCAANYTIPDPINDFCNVAGGIKWGYTSSGATVISSGGNTIDNGMNSGVLSFNKGTTIVTLTGTDGTNAATTTTFTVTVTDNQAPTLVAPANQNLNVIANTCASNYTIADPFTDNCTGGLWGYSTTGATVLTSSGNTKADGTGSGVLSFNKGTTIVTLTGTDGTNAATSTTFTVTVTDNQVPTLLAPANQNLTVIANTCAANYNIPDPISDNCEGQGSIYWGYTTTGATILSSGGNTKPNNNGSGLLSFNKGTTIVTLTGTDGTNAATSTTFTVTVTDNQVPTLLAPANQNLNVIANTCAANYTIADPFTDNCTGGFWGYSTTGATVLTSSGNTKADGTGSGVLSFNKGTTIVTLTGTDGTNAATTTTFTVTVSGSEMNVTGNGNSIANGSTNPLTTNHTDFGNVTLGSTTVKTYTIQNTGNSNLTINSVISSNPAFTIGAVTPVGPIAPGGSATFDVSYLAANNGLQTSTISINNTDCNDANYNFAIVANSACVGNLCNGHLDLTLFLQGFYIGNSQMTTALFNQGESLSTTVSDTITVELHDPVNYGLVHAIKTLLNTNGTAACDFPSIVGNYFIVVKHRNSMETWSANSVIITPTTTYDFSSAASQAYGNNQIQMPGGVYAIYSGDIDQSGGVDGDDFNLLDPDIQFGNGGYLSTDLDGSGGVDSDDFNLFDPNAQNGVGALVP